VCLVLFVRCCFLNQTVYNLCNSERAAGVHQESAGEGSGRVRSSPAVCGISGGRCVHQQPPAALHLSSCAQRPQLHSHYLCRGDRQAFQCEQLFVQNPNISHFWILLSMFSSTFSAEIVVYESGNVSISVLKKSKYFPFLDSAQNFSSIFSSKIVVSEFGCKPGNVCISLFKNKIFSISGFCPKLFFYLLIYNLYLYICVIISSKSGKSWTILQNKGVLFFFSFSQTKIDVQHVAASLYVVCLFQPGVFLFLCAGVSTRPGDARRELARKHVQGISTTGTTLFRRPQNCKEGKQQILCDYALENMPELS
jgi:hypothetical protein